MKKITFLATALFIVVFFASCSKDHGSTLKISGKIQKGTIIHSEKCDNIHAQAITFTTDITETELIRGNVSNGNFSITLPKDVPSSILEPIESGYFNEFSKTNNIELSYSNKNTKNAYIYLDAYNGDDLLSSLICLSINGGSMAIDSNLINGNTTIDMGNCIYFYADSKCTIKGNNETGAKPTINIDVTLYKGWTKVYLVEKFSWLSGEDITISNKISKDYDFKWYFLTDFLWGGIVLDDIKALSDEQKTIVQNFFNKVR